MGDDWKNIENAKGRDCDCDSSGEANVAGAVGATGLA